MLPVVENKATPCMDSSFATPPTSARKGRRSRGNKCSILSSHVATPGSTPRPLSGGQNPLGGLVLGITKPALVLKAQLSSQHLPGWIKLMTDARGEKFRRS